MSADVAALIAGTLLAVGALAFVLFPLFFAVSDRERSVDASRVAEDSPILALREIEFDRATGKLSEADYLELKKTYSERAVRDLRTVTPAPIDTPLDPIEARVRAYRLTHRECATCGVRPEVDAVYCSTCGAYLDSVCPDCGSAITEAGAAFCSSCGATLQRSAPQAVA